MERREYKQVRKARQRKLKREAEANQGDKRRKRLEKYGKECRWSNGVKAN